MANRAATSEALGAFEPLEMTAPLQPLNSPGVRQHDATVSPDNPAPKDRLFDGTTRTVNCLTDFVPQWLPRRAGVQTINKAYVFLPQ
jgi:hypothetical protein